MQDQLTVAEILASRKRPQTSIPLCLRLDIVAEIEELERQIEAGRNSGTDDDPRLTGGDAAVDLADRIRELEEIGRQYTIDLRVEALDRTEWAARVATHTVEGDNGEKSIDMSATVADVLTIPGVVVSPEMTPGQRDDLFSGLSDGQWETVLKKVFDLNRRSVSVGKSLTASLVNRPKNEKRGPAEQ